jgi:hypothetical protein
VVDNSQVNIAKEIKRSSSQKIYNVKGNDKDRKKGSSSCDKEPDNPKNIVEKYNSEEKDIIQILRKDKHFQIRDDKINVKSIDWDKKVELVMRLLRKCKNGESKYKEMLQNIPGSLWKGVIIGLHLRKK